MNTLPHAFTVALIGPDGVGKTTLSLALERDPELRVRSVYMGDNPDSANVTLPTTRWWKRRTRHAGVVDRAVNAAAAGPPTPQHWRAVRQAPRTIRKTAGFCNRICEEAYRAAVARWLVARGSIVVFDRHFLFDYHHTDVASHRTPSFKRRLHGVLMQRIHPQPDLVICLDAPGDVVFARKGEFTPEYLERRRLEYRELATQVRHFAIVDAQRDPAIVLAEVRRAILAFQEGSHGAQD